MGGDGSGRIKETDTVAELLMNDDEFKDFVCFKTKSLYLEVVDKLMSIIRGERKEFVLDSKNGVLIERPTPVGDIVKAAKVLKEMTLDKVVSDKKVVDNSNQGGLFDYLSAVKAVEDKILEEKTARQKGIEAEAASKGKLVKIGGGI